MTSRRNAISRRAALAGIGGLAVGTQASRVADARAAAHQHQPAARQPEQRIPINGKAGAGLEPFDTAMLRIMDRHGIPGAALAIAKGGKLVLAKGFGWANVSTGAPIQPDTLFGLASLSKPITAVATLKLVEAGQLNLNARVFDILGHIQPPRGARVDPRLRTITVQQCLHHTGGWDRKVTGDVTNWEPQICRAFQIRPPVSVTQFLSFTMGVPLTFNPGTDARYSNIGYIVLGAVIARVSGQPYDRFVGENIMKPMGISKARVHTLDGKYMEGEAHRHLAGTLIALPPMQLPMADACGGWSGSAIDMARFMTNLDGSRGQAVLGEKLRQEMLEPPASPVPTRKNGTWFGLGWDTVLVKGRLYSCYKDGSFQGMRTYMKHLPEGVNWALLYNASMEFDPQDTQIAAGTVQEVRKLVEEFDKYPDIDLFNEFS